MSSSKKRDLLADYFDLFNDEVHQFMDISKNTDIDLRGSRVHAKSKLRRVELSQHDQSEIHDSNSAGEDESDAESVLEDVDTPRNEDTTLGVYWSASEKNMFFHCLSRYSIHRIDDWKHQFPHKSQFEIFAYYQVLERNLQYLKKLNTRKHGGIMKRADLPFAYEMDEFFVEFEEKMSASVTNEFDPAMSKHEDDPLLSLDNWNRRWSPLYSRTNIQELLPICKVPLEFSQDAYDYLVECCKEYTKKLIWTSVLSDIEKRSVPNPQHEGDNNGDLVVTFNDSRGNGYCPHVIKKDSIQRAIQSLKQESHAAPTFGETILRSLHKFELDYEENGKLFKTKNIAASMVPTLIHNAMSLKLRTPEPLPTTPPAMNVPETSIAYELFKMHEETNKRSGGQDDNDEQQRPKRACAQPFIEDDALDRINNPLELLLCHWEAELMEAADTGRSQRYQTALLAYFALAGRAARPLAATAFPAKGTLGGECPVGLSASLAESFLYDNA